MAKWQSQIPQIDGVEVIHAPVFKNEDYSPEMMAKCVSPMLAIASLIGAIIFQEVQTVFRKQNGSTSQMNPRSHSITTEKQAHRLSWNFTHR